MSDEGRDHTAQARALLASLTVWQENWQGLWDHEVDEDIAAVAAALQAAHAEGARQEREACAALALNSRPPLSHTAPFAIGYEAACEDIEQAIRQREARPREGGETV
jgi:hypothetical protein